jgi:hypothetical protein
MRILDMNVIAYRCCYVTVWRVKRKIELELEYKFKKEKSYDKDI